MFSFLYRIADLNIRINTITNYVPAIGNQFIIDNKCLSDIVITATEEKIEKYKEKMPEHLREIGFCENLCVLNELASEILKFNTFLIHGVSAKINNIGIIFTGKSGIGKTTHLKLWQELLGEKLVVINGDKSLIRFIDDTPYVFGTPWKGIERIGGNESSVLTDICFIEQNQEDIVYEISSDEAFQKILNQIYIPDDSTKRIQILTLLDKILKKCRFWVIKCGTTLNAAEVAYKHITSQ